MTRLLTILLATVVGVAVIPAAPAAADSGCASGKICTWTGTGFTGDKKIFDASETESAFDLGDHAHSVRSWKNSTQSHWWLADRIEATEYLPLDCLPPGGQDSAVLFLFSDRSDALFRLDTCLLA